MPYRDFFPWYGVLYHYLAALFVGLMGNDLYAVKIYLNLINPILCMALLIAALKSWNYRPLPVFSFMGSRSCWGWSGFISAARSAPFCQSRWWRSGTGECKKEKTG